MNCPLCHEEVLPDAFVCRFCGATLPGAATGVTQRLPSLILRTCGRCGASMEAGFTISLPQLYRYSYWVRGEAEQEPRSLMIDGVSQQLHPIATYRCTGCGVLEAYIEQPPLP
jgi:transcription elongation factor Elf1